MVNKIFALGEFLNACITGDYETVKSLITQINPSAEDNAAIGYASHDGHLEIVKLLLADPRVNPATNNNWPIRCASHNGHLEVVRLLLDDSRVDPSDIENCAVRWAKENGHTEIVQLLTEHLYRVDGPIYNQNII
uniref:Uncharacterized protein n=1 Tax=viral metagenome TaxID=1070528 RepID=A0A6C0JS57_9ZZZZ